MTPLANGNIARRHPHRRARARRRARLAARCGGARAPVHGLFSRRQDHHAAGRGDRRATRSASGATRPRCRCTWRSTPDFGIVSAADAASSACAIAANLRHDALDPVVHEGGVRARRGGPPAADASCRRCGASRARWKRRAGGDDEERRRGPNTASMSRTTGCASCARLRGTPVDKHRLRAHDPRERAWGRSLAARDAAAIYRVQAGGKVRMSTVPAAHEGLGVEGTPGRARRCGATSTS